LENKPANKSKVSAILSILAGVIFILAAFHPFVSGAGIDYVFILIGLVFLVIGIMGVREKKK
jgi:uncharacterized membrane protein HdeD (DUF308 family)